MYRLYVDESGDHALSPVLSTDRQYLALVGCVFDLRVYQEQFQPELEALKARFFRHDPDEPVILHREDIINKRGPFRVLLDPTIQREFDDALLTLVRDAQFRLIVVVIDKKAHVDRYGDAAWHPYHYCLAVLLERYCGFLHLSQAKGDVVAESRGKKEDQQLKDEYKRIYQAGVYHKSGAWFREVLSSHEIKLKPKSKNLAGLQLADLIAHPAKQAILVEKRRIQVIPENFGHQLCVVLEVKYNRRELTGQVWGYGRKFLD